jgi:hypothetical protein
VNNNFKVQIRVLAAYVAVYQVLLKQGYQEYDVVSGTTTIKIKGAAAAFVTSADAEVLLLAAGAAVAGSTVFDSSDLVLPPGEQDAFFVYASSCQPNLLTKHLFPAGPPTSTLRSFRRAESVKAPIRRQSLPRMVVSRAHSP